MKGSIQKILIALCVLLFSACANDTTHDTPALIESMELEYADGFSVDYYDGGYEHIAIGEYDYVLVPEGKPESNLGFSDAIVINMPVKNIYLAASSAMDMFVTLDETARIATCSTKASDYSIPEAKLAIESGSIEYVGKYSAPDYEKILDSGCTLAIESTMITHSPKIREELLRLGIPVLVERSSYESSPLGRLEWIKLYGVLLGCEDEAADFFDNEIKNLDTLLSDMDENNEEKPVVAFFYVSSNGYVNVRKPGDYISKMIDMAGGEYFLSESTKTYDNALSTMNINWEDFYDKAKDADIIIYNSTIDGGLYDREDLIKKNGLFSDFKAVKEDRVYCTTANMFQESCHIAGVISDMYKVINSGDTKDLSFLYKVL